ncbi:MAG: ABC transporter ATP-binding protein [Rhodothalassiaceae bacterium]|nr:MAG: ABC transporter ATP-binding protein [Rhodothalassiaceae bacterium]
MTDQAQGASGPPLILAEGLTKRFGGFLAVDGVDLAVPRGEVLGFLGPNGAGKTTTMKMLTGFLAPTAGRAVIAGHDVALEPLAAKRRFGYLPEGAPLYEDMTVEGFLAFIAEVRGLDGPARRQALAGAVDALALQPVLHRRIETLSKGYRRRVGIAQAILHDPDVLILDEPTDGLDPNQKHDMRALIAEMAPGKAILISTHLLEEVEAICTRAVIIDHGRIVADGTPAALRARSRYHLAVLVEVAAGEAEAARRALAAVDGAAGLEERVSADGVEFVVLAEGGRTLLEPVRAALAAAGIGPRQIALDPGRLDDVFRSLTRSDDERRAGETERKAA